MPLRLYDWKPSPFCMKVRLVLAHKGVPFEKVPVLAHLPELYRRGRVGKVPAIDIDGEFVEDSTDICHRLEQDHPSPPVIPADPRDRAACHLMEELCDESLYFFGLYYHWHEPDGRRRARAFFSRTLVGRVAFWPYLARIERQLTGHGLGRKPVERIRADLERNLDAFEVMLAGRDFLLGSGPYLCDFALVSQLAYLTLAPATQDVVAGRPNLARLMARCPPDVVARR